MRLLYGGSAAPERMNIEKVVRGLGRTQGADTHPDGDLRIEAITSGFNIMQYFLRNNITPSVKIACGDSMISGQHTNRLYLPENKDLSLRRNKKIQPNKMFNIKLLI